VRREVGGLRNKRCYRAIEKAFIAGCRREGFRVCHHSVQRNHIHLIVEARDSRALSRGIQGLSIRIARKLNRTLGRRGKVFADRYFARILRTPREVRNALGYVLNNAARHRFGKKRTGWQEYWFDPYSTASYFDGWRRKASVRVVPTGPLPMAEPETWLLRVGWRRHGLLVPAYVRQKVHPR
jgi:REP element-mobilizing transposase RayT